LDSNNAVCFLKTLEVSLIFNFIIFSLAGDLFTVADHGVSNDKNPFSFAKELCFPDDQTVIFPSTMGFSGEVY
jgi:hypothetical protein